MDLRPYQYRGRNDIFDAWEYTNVVFFQLCTGGGKTVIFTEIIKEFLFRGLRAMLIAHREELIGQAYKTLYQAKILPGIIQGSTPTNYDLPAQVCSIQTIARRSNLPPADLIVIDEGHHVTADNSYGKILQRYPNAKVLIVSATPYRLSGEGFVDLVGGQKTKLIINSTLKDLVEDGWLVPIKYFAKYIPDLSGVDVGSTLDYDDEQAHQAMKLAPIVQSWKDNAKGLQGITFACNVQHSIEIAGQYWREGVPAEHLDANTKDAERKRIISDFAAGLVKVVSNVGILTEGTDFPICDFIQNARPTKSLSMALQMWGRGTRPLKALNIDQFVTVAERRAAIASSAKPHCIVLDCAGLLVEHSMPDAPHDWESHFIGREKGTRKKKAAPVELMDMLIFVAVDALGNKIRTRNPKEIEGLQLIEITQDTKSRVINIKALKEWEHIYSLYKSQYTCKTPGATSLKKYVEYCERNRVLMIPQVWDYLHNELVTKVEERKKALEGNRRLSPDAYPDTLYANSIERIDASGVSVRYLLEVRDKYSKKYMPALIDYANSKQGITA